MTDIAVSPTSDLQGTDWAWTSDGRDIATGDDLQTAIWVSLFSDRVAPDGYTPTDDDRRGWWGDAYRDQALGSRLWTLRRARKSTETLRKAEDYCREALAWMLTDGVAQQVAVKAVWLNGSMLSIDVGVQQTNKVSQNYSYSWVWNSI